MPTPAELAAVVRAQAAHTPTTEWLEELGQLEATASECERMRAYTEELRSRTSDFLETFRRDLVARVGSCCWCGTMWPNPEGDLDRIRAIAAAHDAECPDNPVRIERDRLRDLLRSIGREP